MFAVVKNTYLPKFIVSNGTKIADKAKTYCYRTFFVSGMFFTKLYKTHTMS